MAFDPICVSLPHSLSLCMHGFWYSVLFFFLLFVLLLWSCGLAFIGSSEFIFTHSLAFSLFHIYHPFVFAHTARFANVDRVGFNRFPSTPHNSNDLTPSLSLSVAIKHTKESFWMKSFVKRDAFYDFHKATKKKWQRRFDQRWERHTRDHNRTIGKTKIK